MEGIIRINTIQRVSRFLSIFFFGLSTFIFSFTFSFSSILIDSIDEVAACGRLLEKAGLKGYQVPVVVFLVVVNH